MLRVMDELESQSKRLRSASSSKIRRRNPKQVDQRRLKRSQKSQTFARADSATEEEVIQLTTACQEAGLSTSVFRRDPENGTRSEVKKARNLRNQDLINIILSFI